MKKLQRGLQTYGFSARLNDARCCSMLTTPGIALNRSLHFLVTVPSCVSPTSKTSVSVIFDARPPELPGIRPARDTARTHQGSGYRQSRCSPDRQREAKNCTPAHLALRPYLAPMSTNDRATDAESKAQAATLVAIELPKPLEYAR